MHIAITIEGVSPLLMNRFHDAAQQQVSTGTSSTLLGKKGTPKEQAEPKVYTDSNGHPVVPGPNVFSAIVQAGTFIKAGKSKVTTAKSSLVPAGIALLELECPVIPRQWLVDSRAVVIPSTGGRVMAHRPRFDQWKLSFTLQVDTTMFGDAVVRELVDHAGQRIGLGDFRPARKGPFGRFKVIEWKVRK